MNIGQNAVESGVETKVHLRRLFAETSIVISATDGTKTLYRSGDVFPGYRDYNLVTLGLNVVGQPTQATPVAVYEVIKTGTFIRMFGDSGKIDQLCLEQSQISSFCRNHRDKLRTGGHATHFLFKSEDKFFVSKVCVGRDGRMVDGNFYASKDVRFGTDGLLEVYVDPFMRSGRKEARYLPRLVLPLL